MTKYCKRSKYSLEEPGEDGHQYCRTEVRRSTRLKCTHCGKPLPMRTTVVFELDQKELFVAVYCANADCPPVAYQMDDGRHPFDLED